VMFDQEFSNYLLEFVVIVKILPKSTTL